MTFDRLRQGVAAEYLPGRYSWTGMNHVSAAALQCVLELFPEVFAAVSRFHERHGDFVDETLSRFDRDVASYLAYLRLVERLHRDGLPFCLPEHVVDPAEAYAREGFDIVLADGRHGTPGAVVCDDFRLGGPERLG